MSFQGEKGVWSPDCKNGKYWVLLNQKQTREAWSFPLKTNKRNAVVCVYPTL